MFASTLHHTLISMVDQSLDIQPTVLGYVGKSVALCGKGQVEAALWTFGLAFCCCSPEERGILSLIKVNTMHRVR